MPNNYLSVYIRKSNLDAYYMGEYINGLLDYFTNLIGINGMKLYIRGGCWSKKPNTANELIDILFANIPLDLEIFLLNSYRGYSTTDTYNALQNRGYHNCFQYDLFNDHAKELLLTKDNEIIFYMCGSSNVSKTTYITIDANTNQTDILFINMNMFTTPYIYNILNHYDNDLLKYWYYTSNKAKENTTGSINNHFEKYYSCNKVNISSCFDNNESILDKIKTNIMDKLNK